MSTALHSLGFVPTPRVAVFVAIVTSLPMWSLLSLFASIRGAVVHLRADWIEIVAGVVLVNGITEEVLHRGFVFGHLRRYRSFVTAATLSALLFVVQHLYIVVTNGWTIGGPSVVLAALIACPMAFAFERGGNSIVPPAILYASANAPALVFDLPDDLMAIALVSPMGVNGRGVVRHAARSPSSRARTSAKNEQMDYECCRNADGR